MLRPHILSAALFAACLVSTADVNGQENTVDSTSRRLDNQSQRLENQAQREENQAQRREMRDQNREGVQTQTRGYRGDQSKSHDMEFKYDKVAQLKSKLLDSSLIQQANKEYENNQDELAKKIACEIIVQVLSEDRLFVASLKEKLMDQHKVEVSNRDKQDMHQRIAAQKEMIMNDQDKLKDLLGQVVMRCKVEEKLEHMMQGGDHDHEKDSRQARGEKEEDRN